MTSGNKINLSPLRRLRESFDRELDLDKSKIYGRETYEKYIEMHQRCEVKRDRMIRSLVYTDALLFLLAGGQSFKLPGTDLHLSGIPAVLEVTLFISAIGFFFLCAWFVTTECYSAIIDQFGNRIVDSSLMDPDFFTESRKEYNFFLKIFRPDLNLWGVDFFKYGQSFKRFSRVMVWLTLIAVFAILVGHLFVCSFATVEVFANGSSWYSNLLVIGLVWLLNIGGCAMIFGMCVDFQFEEPVPSITANVAETAKDPQVENIPGSESKL